MHDLADEEGLQGIGGVLAGQWSLGPERLPGGSRIALHAMTGDRAAAAFLPGAPHQCVRDVLAPTGNPDGFGSD
ncbi:hypothetical protein ADK57_02640 [Streptomyces sp. MMG1533]|uniref:hypothetical protein n=1 Tax=Streptomyces sp. MMG1533 TaxID=1415546 RepID=UPI0006AE2F2A|nr:hypothetical protein [Streptomyces sp. MMG1533]KOU77381.1 hypothetical protein ADK57_02640 [Streptomyces sp. MMG1533]